ncbi:alpha/beta hydrolase [Frigidibacter sp. ROC022]|uniref:alpha/beta hydrolase n=1 Tax=Frigidibacter sp. ROC022 TaxID=2971796 RepID=UPI00215B5716|nr:alpha/beta hydrolase [Frigidibacter sp. ROC022]MCR8725397.1 alpha/beta hydrolase [Frigidibacter sp. ROC022]
MHEDHFKIRDYVPEFDEISKTYARLSAATSARWSVTRNIVYGSGDRQSLDVIRDGRAASGRPVHIFIHGGYWRAGRKEDYAFVAEPVIAAGGVAVLVEYDLMPAVRLADLVAQCRAAFAWVADHAGDFGGDAKRITVSGHSAGGHLASWLAARTTAEPPLPRIPREMLLLSGIYDLAPIPSSFLQPEIALTPEEVADWSPMTAILLPGCTRLLAFGADETPPFRDQARAYAAHLGDSGRLLEVAGCNHMNIVLELGNPQHPLGQALMRMVAAE